MPNGVGKERENLNSTKDLSDIKKQQRFTKEQVAILTEMVSEFLMTQGMQIVGNGIDEIGGLEK